jgi:MYXO-CTERM domain-containing protein
MKIKLFKNWSKWVALGCCSAALLLVPPMASGQVRTDTTTAPTYREDANFDWGWLGLLGLLGLAGLKRREHDYHRTEARTA